MQPGNLQCLLGIKCHDFAMVAADQITTQSILIMKNDEDKLYPVTDKLVMGVIGDPGDAIQLTQFISSNIDLYRIKNGYMPTMKCAVHFTRKSMADSLRSPSNYSVSILMAGYDNDVGGQLYYLDALATCIPVPFACHGWGGMFCISILEKNYSPTLDEADAYTLMQMCVREIHQRLIVNLPNFQVKVISRAGTDTLPVICPQTFIQE